MGPDGEILNALPDGPVQETPEPTHVRQPPGQISAGVVLGDIDGDRITKDEVKEGVRAHLAAQRFDVAVAWGRVRGIDVNALDPGGRRYIIEAKAEVGKNEAQQVNYFLGMLGELSADLDGELATLVSDLESGEPESFPGQRGKPVDEGIGTASGLGGQFSRNAFGSSIRWISWGVAAIVVLRVRGRRRVIRDQRAAAKQVLTVGHIGLTMCGTLALSCAAVLMIL